MLLRNGRLAEAARACERVLETSPDDVEALNVCSLASMRDNKFHRAVAMLQRAASIAPDDAITQHNLGRAYEAIGDTDAAVTALGRSVRLQPGYHVARMRLAALLDARGDLARAVPQYSRALADAQRLGRWLDAATTPPAWQEVVRRGVEVVRVHRRAALFAVLEPYVAKYGREALARVEQCLRSYLREIELKSPDPRQAPSFLYFPGMPATPYFDRNLFPWIEEFEAQTDRIRDELEAVLPSEHGRERVFTSDEIEQQNLRGDTGPVTWNGYYFYRHGERRDDNAARCPVTAAAIDALPLSRVPGHGPEVLYSVFTPGTHLLPHQGVTNTRVVGHLPLIIPEACALKVGGEVHEWREGRVVVFDDTYEHEAWNRGERTRVVMIFDLWNPYMTEPEREAFRDLVVDIGEFRAATEGA
jgi:aspartate beta-hydroxylase